MYTGLLIPVVNGKGFGFLTEQPGCEGFVGRDDPECQLSADLQRPDLVRVSGRA
jgi:hypothetical protein